MDSFQAAVERKLFNLLIAPSWPSGAKRPDFARFAELWNGGTRCEDGSVLKPDGRLVVWKDALQKE